MKIVAEEKKIVMGLYFVTLLALMLAGVDNVPLIGVLNKVKYIYILIMLFFCFRDGVWVWNRRFYFALSLLIVHTVLYGLCFINPIIQGYTRNHCGQLLICYLFVYLTTVYVYKKKCYMEFLESSCLALSIFILWTSLTHLDSFVNPIYFINIFSRMDRYRASFGMIEMNTCGNYCLYMIITSLCLMHEWKKKGKKVSKRINISLLLVDFIACYMILSTASRSAILSLMLFCVVGALLKYRAFFRRHWKKVCVVSSLFLVVFIFVAVFSGMLTEIWEQSNREGNLSINLPIFISHGNLINGIGYMDNSGFLNQMLGYSTTAMDIYYLYIVFSTGILGSVLIFGQMIYVLCCLIFYYKTEGRNMALSLFLMMLFYAVWQVNYMNYRYWTGIVHMVILFSFLLRIREEKDTYLICFKRR